MLIVSISKCHSLFSMLTKQRRGKNNNSGDPSLSPDVETARTFAFSLDNKKMKYSFVYKRGGEKKKKKTHTLHRVRSHSRFIYENTAPGWKKKILASNFYLFLKYCSSSCLTQCWPFLIFYGKGSGICFNGAQ